MRQNTTNSKGLMRKTRTTKKYFTNKGTMKRRARDEEEYSEENVIKRLILDIPDTSSFSRKIDTEQFKKEQEEDEKLNEGEEDVEDPDFLEESEEDTGEPEDLFLDREINFDIEIDRA